MHPGRAYFHAAFGSDETVAAQHFIIHGAAEGRTDDAPAVTSDADTAPVTLSPVPGQMIVGTDTADTLVGPNFSQGDGVPSGDCQNPKLYQAFIGRLRLGRERQGVFVACARAAPARLGKMLNGLANHGTEDAARGWW
jgi:hypothetical protein